MSSNANINMAILKVIFEMFCTAVHNKCMSSSSGFFFFNLCCAARYPIVHGPVPVRDPVVGDRWPRLPSGLSTKQIMLILIIMILHCYFHWVESLFSRQMTHRLLTFLSLTLIKIWPEMLLIWFDDLNHTHNGHDLVQRLFKT